ncbi:MAG: N-acetyltransferase [Clostridiales Family XIII bacterium]|jgi:hypothetical protein|nr:N-acetyltransferase [Clostridiales Family XIII bacterium]
MLEYVVANLFDVINEIGEDKAKKLLSNFSCKYNLDVEDFLHGKAIDFSKRSIANTHIVLMNKNGKWVIGGYFSLANKLFFIEPDSVSSKSWENRFLRFGIYYPDLKRYIVPIPLIGQIGKNYSSGCEDLISGAELLQLAINIIVAAQRNLSGKMVYLECADHPKLVDFYVRNGFVKMYNRLLDDEELHQDSPGYLVQFIRYL